MNLDIIHDHINEYQLIETVDQDHSDIDLRLHGVADILYVKYIGGVSLFFTIFIGVLLYYLLRSNLFKFDFLSIVLLFAGLTFFIILIIVVYYFTDQYLYGSMRLNRIYFVHPEGEVNQVYLEIKTDDDNVLMENEMDVSSYVVTEEKTTDKIVRGKYFENNKISKTIVSYVRIDQELLLEYGKDITITVNSDRFPVKLPEKSLRMVMHKVNLVFFSIKSINEIEIKITNI